MALGMSYYEYWYGNAYLVKYYKNAFDVKRKMRNEEMWVQGMYELRAICTALDTTKKTKYYEKPLDIYPKTEDEKFAEKEEMKRKIIEHFNLLKQRWDMKYGND